MPTQSVQQLRDRAQAELASQRLYAPSNRVDVGLLPRRLGPFVERHDAAQRMDFRAFDAHTQNMQKILAAQGKYRQANDVKSATHEVMSLGHALGTAHGELKPQQRAEITIVAMLRASAAHSTRTAA